MPIQQHTTSQEEEIQSLIVGNVNQLNKIKEERQSKLDKITENCTTLKETVQQRNKDIEKCKSNTEEAEKEILTSLASSEKSMETFQENMYNIQKFDLLHAWTKVWPKLQLPCSNGELEKVEGVLTLDQVYKFSYDLTSKDSAAIPDLLWTKIHSLYESGGGL